MTAMPNRDAEIARKVAEIVAQVDEQLAVLQSVEKALQDLRDRRNRNGLMPAPAEEAT